jgi:hypothetical protein
VCTTPLARSSMRLFVCFVIQSIPFFGGFFFCCCCFATAAHENRRTQTQQRREVCKDDKRSIPLSYIYIYMVRLLTVHVAVCSHKKDKEKDKEKDGKKDDAKVRANIVTVRCSHAIQLDATRSRQRAVALTTSGWEKRCFEITVPPCC